MEETAQSTKATADAEQKLREGQVGQIRNIERRSIQAEEALAKSKAHTSELEDALKAALAKISRQEMKTALPVKSGTATPLVAPAEGNQLNSRGAEAASPVTNQEEALHTHGQTNGLPDSPLNPSSGKDSA